MNIEIHNAYENNLKNFSVNIPIGQMTALTGVSGSGKSSLLKNVLAATGARRYSCTQSKTVRSALQISNFIKVEDIFNLPQTIFIDTKNSVTSHISTVSTVSGVHELLRNLFLEIGECFCPFCENKIVNEDSFPESFVVDIVCDTRYNDFLTLLKDYGKVVKELFFDKNQKQLPKKSKAARFAEIHFEIRNCTEKIIEIFNKEYGICVLVDDSERYDPTKKIRCPHCGRTIPKLTRSRMSFSTPFDEGGGMCRECNGSGQTAGGDIHDFILDSQKTFLGGAVYCVNEKGIKYTQINESVLKAFARREGIDLKKKFKELSLEDINKLMYGDIKELSIGIGQGKKKNILYRGVIGELRECFLRGQHIAQLAKYFEKKACTSCHGTRLDKEIMGLRLRGIPLESFLRMTLSELLDWCYLTIAKIEPSARPYIERLLRRVENFCKVSCGHLTLDRSSNTLSGGEIQRIRVCALLNASVNGICYLLDEPSSGLHEKDIESLGALLRDICNNGNTIIIVEHNRKLLHYCDWIVEFGPGGGKKGGTLVFSDKIENICKYNSPTANLLNNNSWDKVPLTHIEYNNFLLFEHLCENNLKDITIKIPFNAFTTLCGISGSGKSTLLRQVLWERISSNTKNYGFSGITYLSQHASAIPYTSTVATVVDCFDVIVKYFSESSKKARELFLPNSLKGKCPVCLGRGVLISSEKELLGTCPQCNGERFDSDVLTTQLGKHQFGELMQAPLSEIGDIITDKTIIRFSNVTKLLGVGYLTLSRRTSSLSKGELQRLKIANAIAQNVTGHIFLLDEPSKGLHVSDATNLVKAIRELTTMGNTVVAVEHTPMVIRQSDYIIELGGTGKNGGYLLYSGSAEEILKGNTPTAMVLKNENVVQRKHEVNAPNNCEYIIAGETFSFPVNSVHNVKDLRNHFENLASMTSSDLLAASIPGNAYYSRAKYYDEKIINSPVLRCIDFAIKKRYDFSLYDVLGLRDAYIKDIIKQHEKSADLFRFLFDDSSLTGKCYFCRGRGKTDIVDEEFFMEGLQLSKETKQFLKSSLSFSDFSRDVKKSHGISFSGDLDGTNIARKILFYGSQADPNCMESDTENKWPGLINFFLRNHAYYPNGRGDEIFASRHEAICPVCSGMMFQEKFIKYVNEEPIRYQDLMKFPLEIILTKLTGKTGERYHCLKQRLELVIKLGLGTHYASERLSDLTEPKTGLVYLGAMLNHDVSGQALLIHNIELLSSALQQNAMDAILQLSRKNTIFIC